MGSAVEEKTGASGFGSERAVPAAMSNPGKRTLTDQLQQTLVERAPGAAKCGMAGGAVGPPRIDLGDHEIGSQSLHEAIVWNTETIDASVIGHVEGHPALQLVSSPSRMHSCFASGSR